MTVKYHVSPDTGRPNICRAEKNCPVGGKHYANKDDARAGYEREMAKNTVVAPVSKNAYVSPFKPRQQVQGVTVWPYRELVEEAGGLGKLEKAYPGVKFSADANGMMALEGPAKKVEAYINEPGGRKADIRNSLKNLTPVTASKETPAVQEDPQDLPVSSGLILEDTDEWAEEELVEEENPTLTFDEEIDIDDDFSDIKCDDCKHPLSECTCGECEYCGVLEDEDHEDYCPLYKPKPAAYSWER